MAFFSILKQGQIYLNTWPLEAKLGIIFPENRIMKATSFAQNLCLLLLCLQFYGSSFMQK